MKIRPGQEPLDRTLDLPEAFKKILLRLPVRISNIVSQDVIPCRGRIRVKERKQKYFRNMCRKGSSQEDGLAMIPFGERTSANNSLVLKSAHSCPYPKNRL
jgi:hypothetical protein